jgi:geranylgeranyl reductase family protein
VRIDAAIIGAGPSGLLAASTISNHGYNVQVFEEHNVIGEPSHCAGLVSVEGLNKLGLKPLKSFTQNRILGGKIFAPNGEHIEIRDSKPRAFVINRVEFDQHLAKIAQDQGADIITSTKVKELGKKGEYNELNTGISEVRSKLVIDAEGAGAKLVQSVIPDYIKPRNIPGINVELTGVEVECDIVEVWFNEELAKDFFIWVIPITNKQVRCGLATSNGNPLASLKKFLKKRFNREEINKPKGGTVVTGGPVKSSSYEGMLVVGDAAGHVKPTTGGGVVLGGLCSKIAGEVGVESLEREDHSNTFLSCYDDRWRKEYGNEFKSMLALHNFMKCITDARFNRLFKAFRDAGLQDVINGLVYEGDMDMQAGIIKKAITNPKILTFLVRGLGKAALSELADSIH